MRHPNPTNPPKKDRYGFHAVKESFLPRCHKCGGQPGDISSLEVARHMAGEGQLAAQRHWLGRLSEEDPGGTGEVGHRCNWQNIFNKNIFQIFSSHKLRCYTLYLVSNIAPHLPQNCVLLWSFYVYVTCLCKYIMSHLNKSLTVQTQSKRFEKNLNR